jgi:hypothetical protein
VRGWFNQSYRHYLAAKGILTGRNRYYSRRLRVFLDEDALKKLEDETKQESGQTAIGRKIFNKEEILGLVKKGEIPKELEDDVSSLDVDFAKNFGEARVEMSPSRIVTPDDALEYLEDNGRIILKKDVAEKIAKIVSHNFVVSIGSPEEFRRRGAMVWSEEEGVAVKDLSVALAKSVGVEPVTHTDFIGRGSGAEDITKKNVERIREKIGGGR